MNGEQRTAALALAGRGVQVDDGHTYGVLAADLVAYGDTIRALVAELDRVAPVCSCAEDVRCGACMTGAVDPVTGAAVPPAEDVREALALAIQKAEDAGLGANGWSRRPGPCQLRAADAILAAFEVRPHGTVTDPMRVLADPKGGCCCRPADQDAGGGYVEHLLDYEPDCPVHSRHLYDPRTGVWIVDPRGTVTDAEVENVPGFDGTREALDALSIRPKPDPHGNSEAIS